MTPLEDAQACLTTRLQDLSQRAASIERSRQHRQRPLSADSEDRATERENDEVLDRLAVTTQMEISQTRHALHRIQDGTYGLCESCGQPIKPSRLRAVPEATQCSGCAASAQRAA